MRVSRQALTGLLALLAVAGAAGAEPAKTRPCRIAVTGAWPTGYLGLLARYGLPREVLLDYQLTDPAAVCRYDLVIIAGLEGGPDVGPAFQRLLEKGGSVLFDCSVRDPATTAWLEPPHPAAETAEAIARWRRKQAAFRMVGQGNPLCAEAGDPTSYPPAQVGAVPVPGEGDTTLAEFVDPFAALRERANLNLPVPISGRHANVPAIVLRHRGQGKLLVCGPSVATATALGGADFDRLVLGMVRVLTDGRAVPALEAESIHLARKQSAGSMKPAGAAGEKPGLPQISIPDRKPGPGKRGSLPAGFTLLEADPGTEYNVAGTMGSGKGEVLLNGWNGAHALRLLLSPAGIQVARTTAGRRRLLAAARAALRPGTPFVAKERLGSLAVMAGAAIVHADVRGIHRGSVAWRGDLGQVAYQPVEPACFGDDFMRADKEDGGWETTGGEWQMASALSRDLGANPFSYRVQAAGPAAALNGFPYWDDCRFSASVRPEAGKGSVGLGFYAQDAANMLLFQAKLRAPGALPAGGLSLVRLSGGRRTLLARAAGGLVAGQWYRLQVKARGPVIEAFVDGVRVLAARDGTVAGGRIALHAEDATARFDDVLVEPSAAPESAGLRLVGWVPPFAGAIDVDSWAGPATPWLPDPANSGLFWRQGAFYGDTGLRFNIPDLPEGAEAMLLLGGDALSPQSGYSLALRRGASASRVELRRGVRVLGQAALPAGAATLSIHREGRRVLGRVNGRVVASATEEPGATGCRLGFGATRFRPRISALTAWSNHVCDYTFDTAPVDWWVGSGQWDLTNRWSCTPEWSWFGGTSEDVAAIWYKHRLAGDMALDFYAAPKMLGEGSNRTERAADFNATICGDGCSVMSGYTVVAAEGGVGARLLREGKVVAESKEFRFCSQIHNRWAGIRVERQGGRVRFLAEGQPILQFDDPRPLPGGYVAIWTRRNGIILPRITLHFERLGGRVLPLR